MKVKLVTKEDKARKRRKQTGICAIVPETANALPVKHSTQEVLEPILTALRAPNPKRHETRRGDVLIETRELKESKKLLQTLQEHRAVSSESSRR